MIASESRKISARTRWALFAVAALLGVSLQACLTGSGEPSGSDAVDFVARGDAYYREGRYADAMAAYDTALLQDSSRSKAYYGYARAVMAHHRVDRAQILSDFFESSSNTSFFNWGLLDHPDSVLTNRLMGVGRAVRMLRLLLDRDTLTQRWKYADDTVTAQEAADSLFGVRRAMMLEYFTKADLGLPGFRQREDFPLTDFRITSGSLAVDMTLLELTYTVTRLYDLDQNDTIDARDELMKKLNFGNTGGTSLDSLSELAGDLEEDTLAAQNLNALIQDMQNGLLNTSELANLIRPPDVDTTNGDSGSQGGTDTIDSVIARMGDAILFYQFGDKLDNDGDGCVDEELMDEKDNDLDGYVDEDARVIPPNKPDGVDNDHDGRMDPIAPPTATPYPPGNDSLGREDTVGVARNAAKPWLLGFVNAYLTANPDSLFIKIRKDAPNLSWRIALQKDSLATKSSVELAGPLKAKLDSAKALVGGCWRNYP